MISAETLPTPGAVIETLDAFVAECRAALVIYNEGIPVITQRLERASSNDEEGFKALRKKHQEANEKINAQGKLNNLFADISQKRNSARGKTI